MSERAGRPEARWTALRGALPARFLPYAGLGLLPLVLYAKASRFGFIPSWDDRSYVLENGLVHDLSLENLGATFTTLYMGSYHPLHLLSYALDYAAWGTDPSGYHVVNALLHALNVCLVYALILRMGAARGAAFAIAAVFAVHPVNVENVAWIAQRKTLLSSGFALISLIAYLSHARTDRPGAYALSLGAFVCALLSKATVLTLPLVLLAHAVLVERRTTRLLRLAPFALASLAALGVTLIGFRSHAQFEPGSLSIPVLFGTVYPTMVPVFWKYLGLLAWPANLSGFYDTQLHHSFLEPPVLISLVAWILVSALLLWRGSPRVRFWYLWFWIWLLPVSNLIPNIVYYADRYLYLPSIGLLALAALAVADLARRRPPTWLPLDIGPGPRRAAGAALLGAVVLGLGMLAAQRLEVWRDELAFWEDTAAKSPAVWKARLNLGAAYHRRGRLLEAEQEYLAAGRIHDNYMVRENLERIRAQIEARGLRRSGPRAAPGPP